MIFLCLFFILQIKNVFGECGCQKDNNLQLSQLLINRDFNKQANSLTTANLPYGFGFPPLYDQAVTFPNALSNDMPLLSADFNTLLANIRALQNINGLPPNALEFQENRADNMLRLKKNMALINDGPQQIDYAANPNTNSYLPSPVFNSNNLPIKDSRSNGIQLINIQPNMNIPITQHVSTNKLLSKNQYANVPFSNSQQHIINDMQNRNTLSGTKMNPIILSNRKNPINEQVAVHSPGLSNNAMWSNDFLNMYPLATDLKANHHTPNLPLSIIDGIPFHVNNGKENIWFLGNDMPARYTQQSDCKPEVLSMKNNDLSVLNNPLNNPFHGGFDLNEFPGAKERIQTDNSLLNILMYNNKSPSYSWFNANEDNIQNSPISKSQNLLNWNILPNGNITPTQWAFNDNCMPNDGQMENFNNLLQNNMDNQNCPLISNNDEQLYGMPDFLNYMSPVIDNFPYSDRVLNYNTPICLANTNVLNLGEFGSLPIINGLPVASIVETVTVLNPNLNYT